MTDDDGDGMGTPAVTLRAMTPDDFVAFTGHALEGYVTQMHELGGAPLEEARADGEASFAALLPQGISTAGQWLFVGEEEGRRIGILWIGEKPGPGPRLMWVYDIEVDEPERGKGYGRALMEAAEVVARELGAARLGLNVFGGNTKARALYDSLGYATNAVQMSKDL